MNPAGEGYVEFDSAGSGADLDTTATVPAFLRIKNDWRLPGIRAGNHDVYLADFDALVTAVADFRIESQRLERRCLRRDENLFLGLHQLLPFK